MRRESRQRGMVPKIPSLLAKYDPRPNSKRTIKDIRGSTSPTAGIFTKAPSKPTNHSKFTVKCHMDPDCKANVAHRMRPPLSNRAIKERRASASPTAGIFIKAPSKPANHSKFTVKCHIDPDCKSKGDHKTRSTLSDLSLVGLRVGVKASGSSATRALDYLDSTIDDCYYYYYHHHRH